MRKRGKHHFSSLSLPELHPTIFCSNFIDIPTNLCYNSLRKQIPVFGITQLGIEQALLLTMLLKQGIEKMGLERTR